MLVRSLRCIICGSYKVTEPKHMYIYCDYCGSWMGLDMKAASKESMSAITRENINSPKVQEFNMLSMEIVDLGKALDVEGFKKAQLKYHEMEFEIFPMRHGAKGKQISFQKKYLDFYKAYYNEVVDKQYLDKKYVNPTQVYDMSKLTFRTENGRVIYEFDENFKEMIDVYKKHIIETVEREKQLKCMAIHPEPAVIENKEVLLRMSLHSFVQVYDGDIAEKIVQYLGLENSYIEIDNVNMSDFSCKVCSAKLQVPEGASTTLCEQCGTLNDLKNLLIKCHNCGASFDPIDKNSCPYCETLFQKHGSVNDLVAEEYKKINTPTKEKKSFFKRLFGG